MVAARQFFSNILHRSTRNKSSKGLASTSTSTLTSLSPASPSLSDDDSAYDFTPRIASTSTPATTTVPEIRISAPAPQLGSIGLNSRAVSAPIDVDFVSGWSTPELSSASGSDEEDNLSDCDTDKDGVPFGTFQYDSQASFSDLFFSSPCRALALDYDTDFEAFLALEAHDKQQRDEKLPLTELRHQASEFTLSRAPVAPYTAPASTQEQVSEGSDSLGSLSQATLEIRNRRRSREPSGRSLGHKASTGSLLDNARTSIALLDVLEEAAPVPASAAYVPTRRTRFHAHRASAASLCPSLLFGAFDEAFPGVVARSGNDEGLGHEAWCAGRGRYALVEDEELEVGSEMGDLLAGFPGVPGMEWSVGNGGRW